MAGKSDWGQKPSENVEIITIQHQDSNSIGDTQTVKTSAPYSYYDKYLSCTSLYQKAKSVFPNVPDEQLVPHMVSTIDLANCLRNMLDTWNDVLTKRDPYWKGVGCSVFGSPSSSGKDKNFIQSAETGSTENENTASTYLTGSERYYWRRDDVTDEDPTGSK